MKKAKMDIEKKTIDKIFKALNDQIGIHNGHLYSLVICGCTALIARGLADRKTKDIDVLGEVSLIDGSPVIKRIHRFPSWFTASVNAVYIDLKMPDNWFNAGPSIQVDYGLPEGIESRLEKKSYGDFLNIYYISRIDQIHFKLNHSLCIGGIGYQVDDLIKLNPTQDEIIQACTWLLDQYKSENIKKSLLDFLERAGLLPGISDKIFRY